MNVQIKPIQSQQTLALRHQILRPHQAIADCIYPEDKLESCFHLGGFVDDKLCAIISLYRDSNSHWPDETLQWRLRGMAVLPELQGQGIGKQLVHSAIESIKIQGGGRLWMNARDKACQFYSKIGFVRAGQRFELEGIGLHWVMHLLVLAQT